MNAKEFRAQLEKIMPGYRWTVHQSSVAGFMSATGTQSSGSNRLSTLRVERRDRDGEITFETKSSGYGLRAPWLHVSEAETLARALRGLQDHYEHMAANYRAHASALQQGRMATPNEAAPGDTSCGDEVRLQS
jgi:hypothetical protein